MLRPVLVFAGPSLPWAVRPQHPRLEWAPPAIAGDLLARLDAPPAAVALIDGLFDSVPAVRHKEILALMARGTRVLGAASMGALRAAELAPFGMQPVGAIADAYVAGRLTGDDEVALAHGPAELGWPGLTEPLVNVRATLIAARRSGVLGRAQARAVLAAARAVFWQDRSWAAVIAEAGAPARPLGAWLPGGRIDLKRRDALACVAAALAARAAAAPSPEPPHTLFTIALAERAASSPVRGVG